MIEAWRLTRVRVRTAHPYLRRYEIHAVTLDGHAPPVPTGTLAWEDEAKVIMRDFPRNGGVWQFRNGPVVYVPKRAYARKPKVSSTP